MNEPLRLFFAGILGPRKGIHSLFAALSKLPAKHYHLTLAGRWQPGFREWLSKRYPLQYEWLGQIAHEQVYDVCRGSHIFVFPSLAEGFGLVILMASGIPVLTTDHTAGPELIDHDVDGWIIPAGDTEALECTLHDALEHRNRLPEMGRAARRKASTFSWQSYRQRLP